MPTDDCEPLPRSARLPRARATTLPSRERQTFEKRIFFAPHGSASLLTPSALPPPPPVFRGAARTTDSDVTRDASALSEKTRLEGYRSRVVALGLVFALFVGSFAAWRAPLGDAAQPQPGLGNRFPATLTQHAHLSHGADHGVRRRADDSTDVMSVPRAGQSVEKGTDAEPGLFTYQCDVVNCERQNPTPDGVGSVYQYVDDRCGPSGGLGCEGANGGETHCRLCYVGDDTDFEGYLGYPQCPMCVCEQYDLPRDDCTRCTASYKYFKFEFTGARSQPPPNGALQFGELTLFASPEGASPVAVDPAWSTNPDGSNALFLPRAAVDGDASTKVVDSNFVSNGEKSTIILSLRYNATMVRGYEVYTSDDQPGSDPVEWTLWGGATPTGPWYVLSRVAHAEPPESRATSYGVFDPCESRD